jgi:hypothetical protein
MFLMGSALIVAVDETRANAAAAARNALSFVMATPQALSDAEGEHEVGLQRLLDVHYLVEKLPRFMLG